MHENRVTGFSMLCSNIDINTSFIIFGNILIVGRKRHACYLQS